MKLRNTTRPKLRAPAMRLVLDGAATGLRARDARNFLDRALGLLRAPPAGQWAGCALRLRPCAAVHTFGMRHPIDVVFVDRHGTVLRIFPRLGPWRIAGARRAVAAWELPMGEAMRLGIERGSRLDLEADVAVEAATPPPACAASRQDGVVLVEFLLAAVLVLLPLTFATLELAQLMVARHALGYATFEAARTGALTGASPSRMRAALARALLPLFAPLDPVATLRGTADDSAGGSSGLALARATTEVLRPDLTRLVIENPTPAAAADFAAMDDDTGRRVIPNDGLEFRNPRGANSGQTLREANVLAIRVRYCRQLVMPGVREFVPAILRWNLSDPRDQACLAQGRVPIEATAVVHMQSPVEVDALGS